VFKVLTKMFHIRSGGQMLTFKYFNASEAQIRSYYFAYTYGQNSTYSPLKINDLNSFAHHLYEIVERRLNK